MKPSVDWHSSAAAAIIDSFPKRCFKWGRTRIKKVIRVCEDSPSRHPNPQRDWMHDAADEIVNLIEPNVLVEYDGVTGSIIGIIQNHYSAAKNHMTLKRDGTAVEGNGWGGSYT